MIEGAHGSLVPGIVAGPGDALGGHAADGICGCVMPGAPGAGGGIAGPGSPGVVIGPLGAIGGSGAIGALGRGTPEGGGVWATAEPASRATTPRAVAVDMRARLVFIDGSPFSWSVYRMLRASDRAGTSL